VQIEIARLQNHDGGASGSAKAYRAKHDGMPLVLIATGSTERAKALAARLGLPSCYFEYSGAVGLLACEESISGSHDPNGST